MRISVITATYNAAEHLPRSIKSLQDQTDKGFEWVVADGVSTDGTLELLRETEGLDLVITSEPDFGIYDALNRGIKKSKGEFYLILGADDYLYPDAIENFKKEITSDVDIIAASLKVDNVVKNPARGRSWLYGQSAFVAGHSTATLFKKSLHDQFGYYSKMFPIAADQLFIKNSCQNGARIKKADFISGIFCTEGVSGVDRIGAMTEFFRVQLLTEKVKKLANNPFCFKSDKALQSIVNFYYFNRRVQRVKY